MSKINSDAISAVIASELQDGENVVWSGTQNPGRFVNAFLLKALIPALWTVCLILFAVMTNAELHWADTSRWESFHWAAAFVASIGPIGMLASVLAFKTQHPTIYFVTNRRAVAMSGKGFGRVESYWPDQLNNTIRTKRPDGTGDIQFERVRQIDGSGEFVVRIHGFYGIQNADQVERHIVELRQSVQ
ncbi:hypothetical protein [Undibacterium sp. Di24W]|uniref:hypothetical protein n=1 Tax=Undibacterium sp. Di24W TaxID=3413033 RepID=UPI003BEF7503